MRNFDWEVMIINLQKKGITQAEIARITDFPIETISSVKQERRDPPKAWNSAISFLDLYIKHFGSQVPRIGDYYEDEISTTE